MSNICRKLALYVVLARVFDGVGGRVALKCEPTIFFKAATCLPIEDVATAAGVQRSELELYGDRKAKVWNVMSTKGIFGHLRSTILVGL